MTHIIRRQYLHVELNGTESEGLALQSRLPGLCREWLNPVLERALDNCVPSNESWSIERLDIDAGTLNLERLEHDLAESAAKALEKALQEQIPSHGNYSIAEDNYSVQYKTTQQTLEEAFSYFLKTGSLPWAFRLPVGKNLEQTILEFWQESNRSSVDKHLFNDAVVHVHALASATARKRLIWQFSPVFLEILLASLSAEGKKAIDSILQALDSSDVPSADAKQFKKQLWETAFALVAKGGAVTEKHIAVEIRLALPVLSLQKKPLTSFLESHWPDVTEKPAGPSPSPETLLAKLTFDEQKAIERILQALHNAGLPQADVKEFEKQLWKTAFALSAKGGAITEKHLAGEIRLALPVASIQKTALTSFLEDRWPDVTQVPAGPSPSTETLLAKLSFEDQKVMERILQALRNSGLPQANVKPFEKQLWITVADFISNGKAIIEKQIIGETWRTLPVPVLETTVLSSFLEHHWPGVTQSSDSHPQSSIKTGKIPGDALSPAARRAPLPDELNFPAVQETEKSLREMLEISLKENFKAGLSSEELTTSSRESGLSQRKHPDEKEGIYIQNAGLVLLHPFLPQFFEALGIAAEDKLLKPGRALCLLHFLTTGQTIAPEYELILPKILCNIPLETPVESDAELTGPEKEEAAALLEAVIRHWDALRNSGIDGLRGTFLLRFGKLSLRSDGDWLLQVESNTVDILLNHLPWGIAMIKLPWMQRMLWVEWAN